jgi:gluconolactonase
MVAVEVVANGLAHPEGPDVLADGRIVFVETFRGRLLAWSEATGLQLYAHVGGGPNACMLGTDGVYVTQNGGTAGPWRAEHPVTPSIQRVTWNGETEVVADQVDGTPLHAPNDLTFGPDGRLYFTDPGAYDPDNPTPGRVCVIATKGECTVLEEVGPSYPNGIVAESDGAIVWVESYTRHVRRRRPDGRVELLATLPDAHIPDGLKVGVDGNLYITSVTSGGVDVVGRDGELVAFIATGGEPQNCAFHGTDLYVTDFGESTQYADDGLAVAPACGRLLRVGVGVEGRPLFRGAIARRGHPGPG